MSSLVYEVGLYPDAGAISSSIGADYQIETTHKYKVIVDASCDETWVRANWGSTLSPPLGLYSSHPSEPFTRIKRVNASLVSRQQFTDSGGVQHDARQWTVDVTFGFLTYEQLTQTSLSGDPGDAQIQISFEPVEWQKPVDVDVNGVPVLNSANMPYDPPVMRDDTRWLLKITRNEKLLSLADLASWANVVNADTFNGCPPKTWKVSPPRIVGVLSPYLDLIYYRVEWALEYNPDTWQAIVLDAGYQELVLTMVGALQTYDLVNIRDKQGMLVQGPTPLNGNGAQLTRPVTSKNAVFNKFDIYKSKNFADLNFPDNVFVTRPFL